MASGLFGSLRRCHNERDGVSNYRCLDFARPFFSGADRRIDKKYASLAFVRGIHRPPVHSPCKEPVTQKMFPFDDVIITSHYLTQCILHDKRTLENYFQWESNKNTTLSNQEYEFEHLGCEMVATPTKLDPCVSFGYVQYSCHNHYRRHRITNNNRWSIDI